MAPNWIYPSDTEATFRANWDNAMDADALAPCVTATSSTTVLTTVIDNPVIVTRKAFKWSKMEICFMPLIVSASSTTRATFPNKQATYVTSAVPTPS